MGKFHWKDAGFVSRYDENSCMSLVGPVAAFASTEPLQLERLSHDAIRTFILRYEKNMFEVARVARDIIPAVPARV